MIPRRIALVSAIPASGTACAGDAGVSEHDGAASLDATARFVLSDLAEAYTVYTRMGAVDGSAPEVNSELPPACHLLEIRDGYQGGAGAGSAPASAGHSEPFDALVVALALDLPDPDALVVALALDLPDPDAPIAALSSTLDHLGSGLLSGSPVYALLLTPSAQLGSLDHLSPALSSTCQAHGLSWNGALVIADAAILPALARSPRMGMFRRPVSEAIDRLILALRTGSVSADEVVCPRIPCVARHWFTRLR